MTLADRMSDFKPRKVGRSPVPVVPGFPPSGEISRTAETATASTVHHPIGQPGGPGLFRVAGMQLPAYIQNLRDGLMRAGHSESQATEMAIGIVRDWRDGHTGSGKKVSPEVQAAATKAIAEYDADRAKAHATRSDMSTASRAEMSTQDINNLPDSAFAYIEPGGKKDASGKTTPRSKRHFPIHDKPHIADALSRAPQSPFGDKAMPAIKAAAKKAGIGQPAEANRLDTWGGLVLPAGEIYRAFTIESAEISRADRTGRTVEAYAAVFGEPYEVSDHEGEYEEVVAPVAFNKRLADLSRSKTGFKAVKVLYNHGMTLHGTPSERFSMPVGVPDHIGVDSRGLITRTRYLNTPLADEILECVNEGAMTTQSFTGRIVRSNPQLRPGQVYRASYAGLPRVTRIELGLREFGFAPFAANQAAELVGVRMAPLGTWSNVGHADTDPALEEDGEAVTWYDPDSAPPPDGEAAPGEPEASRSGDGLHSDPSVSNRLFNLRLQQQLAKAGITLRGV